MEVKVSEIYVDLSNRFKLQATTKGNQIKWFKGNRWIKADSMGYESIAEYLISLLEGYIKNFDYVKYDLCTVRETGTGNMRKYNCCVSDNFLTGNEYIVSAQRMIYSMLGTDKAKHLMIYTTGLDLLAHTIDICHKVTNLSVTSIMRYFANICRLDALTLNEDRHLNNIAFVYNGQGYRFAPIFDNGMGLLADLQTFPLNRGIAVSMEAVRARPFSGDFIEQALYFSDFSLLKIEYNSFREKVQSLKLPEREKEFNRARDVLLRRLESTKGVVWDEVR